VLEAGDKVSEKSLVFTMEEGEKLKKRIEELEKKEALLEEYKKLEILNNKKIDLCNSNVDIYKDQVLLNKDIINLQSENINNLRKINKYSELKSVGYFTLGVAITVSSILLADKVNDSIR